MKTFNMVRNSLNAATYSLPGQRFKLPSLTVPDQAMSVKEILDRFSRGLALGGSRVPVYDEDDDLPDLRTLDLAERQELKEAYESEIVSIQKRDNDYKEQQRRKASSKRKDEAEEAEVVEPVEPVPGK